MRAGDAVRHNAAVGAVLGLATADALGQSQTLPPLLCGGEVDLGPWGTAVDRSFAQAELVLKGRPVAMDLSAVGVFASAIALAQRDADMPLLADPDAASTCGVTRDALAGRMKLDTVADVARATPLAEAARVVRSASNYTQAVTEALSKAAGPDTLALTGALAGLRWGPAAIPSTWVTTLSGSVGSRNYGLRQLRRLAERLVGLEAPSPPEPRRSLGPREVAPRLWLSNLHAVPRFLAERPDGAVISLCPTTGAFDLHRIRREFALHDAAGSTVNPHLATTVDEVLDSIRAFHDEGRDVLVHCHHGASRTGLVLRAWLMHELDLDADGATSEAQARWSATSTWNRSFNAEITRRAGSRAN